MFRRMRRTTSEILATQIWFTQGDADQIVPIDNAGKLQASLVKKATLKVVPGAPHGLCTMHADLINEGLFAFLKQ
jgi:non-heme chloroperoxidase